MDTEDKKIVDINAGKNVFELNKPIIKQGVGYNLFYDVKAFREYVKKAKLKISYYTEYTSADSPSTEGRKIIQLHGVELNGEIQPMYFCFVEKTNDGKMYIHYDGELESVLGKKFESGFHFTNDTLNDMILKNVITSVVELA